MNQGLFFPGHFPAATDRRAQDIAERGARIGRAIFAHGFAFFFHFLALDGERQAARGTVHGGDLRIDLFANGEFVGALVATVAGQFGATDEACQHFINLHLNAVLLNLGDNAGDDITLAHAVQHFGGGSACSCLIPSEMRSFSTSTSRTFAWTIWPLL